MSAKSMQVMVIGGHGGVSFDSRATSYLIDGKLLIDAGSVASGLSIADQLQIDHILISHAHLDHISDLAYLSDNCFGQKENPFEVYASAPVVKAIKDHIFNDVVWPDFSVLPSSEKPTMRFNTITHLKKKIVLGDYEVYAIAVNHSKGAMGFIVQKGECALLFTQDTAATEEIWEFAREFKTIKGIFTEISFPNHLQELASLSQHHTPNSLFSEMDKMPKDVKVHVGHLKPNFENELKEEIKKLNTDRIVILGSQNKIYSF